MPRQVHALGLLLAMFVTQWLAAQPSSPLWASQLTRSGVDVEKTLPAPRPLTGAPTVIATAPPSGGGTAGNDAITIQFSEAVNVTGTPFHIVCPPGGAEQSFSISPTPPGASDTFSLTPSPALPVGMCVCTVVGKRVASVADGTEMQRDYQFTFHVIPE
jgi:Bacterial Ig-like domain